jgi:hypothetical protein
MSCRDTPVEYCVSIMLASMNLLDKKINYGDKNYVNVN